MHPSGRRSGGILRLYARSEHFVDPVPAAETRELFSCGIRPDGAFALPRSCAAVFSACAAFCDVKGIQRSALPRAERKNASGLSRRSRHGLRLLRSLRSVAPRLFCRICRFYRRQRRKMRGSCSVSTVIKTQSRRKPAVRRRAQWRAPFAAAAKVLIRRLSRRLRTYHSRKNLPV